MKVVDIKKNMLDEIQELIDYVVDNKEDYKNMIVITVRKNDQLGFSCTPLSPGDQMLLLELAKECVLGQCFP